MLEKVNLKEKADKEEYKKRIKELRTSLSSLDMPMKAAKLPVIILFEGFGGAGKGSTIANLILNFDPRWFSVVNTQPPTESEMREPMMWRHWLTIPESGQMSIMDRSWYQEISTMRIENNVDELTNLRHMNEINSFERGLCNNGYLIIKFFLHISKKEMKARMDRLSSKKSTAWRVSPDDRKRLKNYEKYREAFDQMLEYTNTPSAPWHPVSGMDKMTCILTVFETVKTEIEKALQLKKEKDAASSTASAIILPGQYNFVKMPELSDIDPDKDIDPTEYKKELEKEQKKLWNLQNRLYLKKIPVVIAYEGWDAAGKGGNIKRVSQALDPRGYEVMPIASPTADEKNRHFLWRFWKRLPKDGHTAIFDRTWYGRVMVERIEGFCSIADWQRAYGEINDFERQLYDWGAVIIKFWLQISSDEQLARFNDRKNTPSKQWKITDEDWRNRKKWAEYEIAVNDMLKYTSTDFAPWHIIESNNKQYARVKTLKIINSMLSNKLKSK